MDDLTRLGKVVVGALVLENKYFSGKHPTASLTAVVATAESVKVGSSTFGGAKPKDS